AAFVGGGEFTTEDEVPAETPQSKVRITFFLPLIRQRGDAAHRNNAGAQAGIELQAGAPASGLVALLGQAVEEFTGPHDRRFQQYALPLDAHLSQRAIEHQPECIHAENQRQVLEAVTSFRIRTLQSYQRSIEIKLHIPARRQV